MNPKKRDDITEVQQKTHSSWQPPVYRLSFGDGLRAMRADRVYSWLVALFIALNVADLVVTLIVLYLGGVEANPLFNPILSRSAVTAGLLKFVGMFLLTTILLTTFLTMPRLTRWVAAFLCLILGIFVANDVWTAMRPLAR